MPKTRKFRPAPTGLRPVSSNSASCQHIRFHLENYRILFRADEDQKESVLNQKLQLDYALGIGAYPPRLGNLL